MVVVGDDNCTNRIIYTVYSIFIKCPRKLSCLNILIPLGIFRSLSTLEEHRGRLNDIHRLDPSTGGSHDRKDSANLAG